MTALPSLTITVPAKTEDSWKLTKPVLLVEPSSKRIERVYNGVERIGLRDIHFAYGRLTERQIRNLSLGISRNPNISFPFPLEKYRDVPQEDWINDWIFGSKEYRDVLPEDWIDVGTSGSSDSSPSSQAGETNSVILVRGNPSALSPDALLRYAATTPSSTGSEEYRNSYTLLLDDSQRNNGECSLINKMRNISCVIL